MDAPAAMRSTKVSITSAMSRQVRASLIALTPRARKRRKISPHVTAVGHRPRLKNGVS